MGRRLVSLTDSFTREEAAQADVREHGLRIADVLAFELAPALVSRTRLEPEGRMYGRWASYRSVWAIARQQVGARVGQRLADVRVLATPA